MSNGTDRIGLPPRTFFYTIDQIATLLSVKEDTVKQWLHFANRSVGPCPKDKILAHNLAPAGEKPIWRVAEKNFVSWMRFKGLRYHERGYIK